MFKTEQDNGEKISRTEKNYKIAYLQRSSPCPGMNQYDGEKISNTRIHRENNKRLQTYTNHSKYSEDDGLFRSRQI